MNSWPIQSTWQMPIPPGTEHRRLVVVAFATEERGDRRQMIRFERVPHPEERAETGARENLEYWHNGAFALYRLRLILHVLPRPS